MSTSNFKLIPSCSPLRYHITFREHHRPLLPLRSIHSSSPGERFVHFCGSERFVRRVRRAFDCVPLMATLEKQGEMRERPSLEGEQQQEPTTHADVALQRTPEIRETESGNIEVRKDPEHTSKLSKPAEKILDPRGASVATNPSDILAVKRSVDEADTPLE